MDQNTSIIFEITLAMINFLIFVALQTERNKKLNLLALSTESGQVLLLLTCTARDTDKGLASSSVICKEVPLCPGEVLPYGTDGNARQKF